ncbi:MAG: hypothetical protein ACRCZE_05355 [Candidatus Altimarinota bacterium]
MPKYSYTVINRQNQQLNGTINAPDETTARHELNGLGFSILILNVIPEDQENVVAPEDSSVLKFEFIAFDKAGKKVVGSIQGMEIFQVYKRLILEYQFDVQALYLADLTDQEKEKAIQKGIEELKDRLLEEKMEEDLKHQQEVIDQKTFEEQQAKLKNQVEFVLKKVNEIIDTYRDELSPPIKTKLKYYVEKILRIKNSTNLNYIQSTTEEMLNYLQKEELFLNQEQKLKERTKLSIEAKSMMMKLHNVNSKAQADVFDLLRDWRDEHIINKKHPNFLDNLINVLITPIIGAQAEDRRIIEAKIKYKQINKQIRDFIIIYFQAPNKEYKRETLDTIKSFWNQRNILKRELKEIIKQVQSEKLNNNEISSGEIVLREIYNLFCWVLCFYLIYYFGTIYLNSKQIDFPFSNLNLIFQTSFIKYFFIFLFLAVCFIGIKLEFLKRRTYLNPPILAIFIFTNLLLIINF